MALVVIGVVIDAGVPDDAAAPVEEVTVVGWAIAAFSKAAAARAASAIASSPFPAMAVIGDIKTATDKRGNGK